MWDIISLNFKNTTLFKSLVLAGVNYLWAFKVFGNKLILLASLIHGTDLEQVFKVMRLTLAIIGRVVQAVAIRLKYMSWMEYQSWMINIRADYLIER